MVEDNPKGKPCQECGSPLANLYGSGGGRICSGCKREFEWELDKDQQPLIGSNRSGGMGKIKKPDQPSEDSIDVVRSIDFIKKMLVEREAAEIKLLEARKAADEADSALAAAEESLEFSEYALDAARKKLKEFLIDEGVMSNKNLPAFPVTLNEGETFSSHGDADGITIRDYFAAKAMAANIAGNLVPNATLENIADYSYVIADEMLRAREK